MKHFRASTAVALVGLATVVAQAGDLKSGPQVGKRPGNFFFKVIVGPDAPRTFGHYWKFRSRPVVCIFTRTLSDDLASLLKQVDDKIVINKDQQMNAFVVYLTDDREKAQEELKALAAKHKIPNIRLTLPDTVMGPKNYKIAPEAEVTVLMWSKRKVRVNHAFTKGKLDKTAVSNVVTDTQKILK